MVWRWPKMNVAPVERHAGCNTLTKVLACRQVVAQTPESDKRSQPLRECGPTHTDQPNIRSPQTRLVSPPLSPAQIDVISSPQLEEGIPTARAERSAVLGHTKARDTVIVAREATDLLARERVPHVTIEIVVSGKQETARDRMRYRYDAAKDLVVSVLHELVAAAHIEEAA